MYKISTPFVIHERTDKEKMLKALKKMSSDRVFLAIEPCFYNRQNQVTLNRLKPLIPYFKQHGYEVGVWLWTFWRRDPENVPDGVYPITGFDASTNRHFCPSSPEFVKQACEFLSQIALLSPDIILFDDDYRFGFLPTGYGCCCPNHLKMLSDEVGEEITREGLEKKLFSGKGNKYRSAYLRGLSKSLTDFAYSVRAAVNKVNENIRIGLCSCMSLWDADGVDSVTISRILAGNTKPLLRYIGAPYWAALDRTFGCNLQHVIETERMQYSWGKALDITDIETMTEGDTYPRPRHLTPSSFLEGFDMATRAYGISDGILKYTYDYNSSTDYEPRYADSHIKNTPLYNDIQRIFAHQTDTGVYIYEALNKIENADFGQNGVNNAYVQNMFFSQSAKFMSDNSIPTTYENTGAPCAVFGENARSVRGELLQNGAFIDIIAAKILTERGIDVGISEIQNRYDPELLYYPHQNEHAPCRANGTEYKFTPKAGAVVLTEAVLKDGNIPECIFYQNANGQRFVVFGFDGSACGERRRQSYCLQNLLFQGYELLANKPCPVVCKGNPNLYIVCRRCESETSIGLFNFFADSIYTPIITLDKQIKNVEFINCSGTYEGNTITLSDINAYDITFLRVEH